MTDKVTGPHELQTVPAKAFAQDMAKRATYTTERLRHLPIESLELAGKLTPFALLRAPIALTEAVVRRVLLPDGEEKEVNSGVYPGASDGMSDESFTAPPDAHLSVRSMVQELLDRSVRQSPQQAVEANYKRLLLQLVPDEVRVLHTLSDGKPRVMEHVGVGTMGGSADKILLRYASPVGTEAGVRCPDAVPEYLSHLLDLDLIEIGDEDESMREQYEILDTFSEVEEAEEDAKSEPSTSSKMLKFKTAVKEKHTVTISDLGKRLWEAAHPDTHTFMIAEQREEPDISMDGDLPPE